MLHRQEVPQVTERNWQYCPIQADKRVKHGLDNVSPNGVWLKYFISVLNSNMKMEAAKFHKMSDKEPTAARYRNPKTESISKLRYCGSLVSYTQDVCNVCHSCRLPAHKILPTFSDHYSYCAATFRQR